MDKLDIVKEHRISLKEISQIKEELDEINEKKESWFKKKEDFKKEINDKINAIKDLKIRKDKENLELKKQRNRHNDAVRELVKKLKKLHKDKEKIFKDYNIKINPSKILDKITDLEKQVEIETSFEKEQKLMEQIKKLRKSYDESSKVSEILKDSEDLSRSIKESKSKADEFHKQILELTNSPSYNQFIMLSKEINELKKIQEDAFNKFIEYKNQFNNKNNQLKELLRKVKEERQEMDNDKELLRQEKEAKNQEIIEKKSKDIERKLKEKKKLTTEDLIVLQAEKNDESN